MCFYKAEDPRKLTTPLNNILSNHDLRGIYIGNSNDTCRVTRLRSAQISVDDLSLTVVDIEHYNGRSVVRATLWI